jgi:hypothetical protein
MTVYMGDSEETQCDCMKMILMYSIITAGNSSENLACIHETRRG